MINSNEISKFFTEAEANKSLVLVSKIANDIESKSQQLQLLKSKLLLNPEDLTALEEAQNIGNQIIHHAHELEDIGAQIINITPIIIGFPHIKDDEIGFFTWGLEQDKVKIQIIDQLVK
jgi:hypothetical protein